MSTHGYESGRLNLPFVGISIFAKKPYVADRDRLDADVAIIGAPFDCGTQYRSGARVGPRGVREGYEDARAMGADILSVRQTRALGPEAVIAGIDLVEVAPDYDQSNTATILAAQLLPNFLGFVFANRGP